MAFPKIWAELKEKLKPGAACIAEGRPDDRGQMILDKIILPDELENARRYFNIPVDLSVLSKNENFELKDFVQKLRGCKGNAKVILDLHGDDSDCKICLGGISVDPEKAAELALALSA